MQEPWLHLIKQALGEKLGEKVSIESLKTLSGGCINHASRLETNLGPFFLKWSQGGKDDIFLREAEGLQEMAKADTELHIPRVYLAYDKVEGLPPLLLTEFLHPSEESPLVLDEKLGRGIAQLHRFQAEKYGFENDNYCGSTPQDNHWNTDWVDFFGQQRIAALLNMIEQKRELGSADLAIYDQLISRLPSLIGHQPAASLNHGDLWSGNFMHTARGPALIDPACYYADREFDLAMMAMFGGFGQRVWDAYREAYPLDEEWRHRHDLYMLYHYLNHYYLFGGQYGQQALSIARQYL
jgi:fructosamine-3-kinase